MAIGVSSMRRMRSNEASSDSNALAKRAGAALTATLFRNAGWRTVVHRDTTTISTHTHSNMTRVSAHLLARINAIGREL